MKKLRYVLACVLTLALLGGMVASPAAADIIIDDFTVAIGPLTSVPVTVFGATAGPVPGGVTEFSVTNN